MHLLDSQSSSSLHCAPGCRFSFGFGAGLGSECFDSAGLAAEVVGADTFDGEDVVGLAVDAGGFELATVAGGVFAGAVLAGFFGGFASSFAIASPPSQLA